MLDGNDRRHAVSHVRSCKIHVLFLQNIQFPGIAVDDRRKLGLKACQMGAPLRVVDIIAKAQHIFMEFVDILESALHDDAFILPFKIDDVRHRLAGLIDILDKADDALRLVVLHHLGFLFASVLKMDGQLRI